MAKRDENRIFWAVLAGLGLWWWTSRSVAGAIEGITIIPEPNGPTVGQTIPSSTARYDETGLMSGLRWRIWAECSPLEGETFCQYHMTIRNSIGQLLHHSARVSWIDSTPGDRAAARIEQIAQRNTEIRALTGG